MKTVLAATALLASAALAPLTLSGPAHAFVRGSVATTLTITVPTTPITRGDYTQPWSIDVTTDPSYTGDITGFAFCQFTRDGLTRQWKGAADVTPTGHFTDTLNLTAPAGTWHVTCGFKPEFQWSILAPSNSDTATYTVVEAG